MRLVLIDHRDSFVWNVVRGLEAAAHVLGRPLEIEVVRGRDLDPERLRVDPPARLVLGPGPGDPRVPEARAAMDLAARLPGGSAVLGICLGHQIVAAAHGARVTRGERPVHGHAHGVEHDARGLFEGLESPLLVGRYHSLAVEPESLPASLEVSARGPLGEVMALRARDARLESVQFHPDSALSERGVDLFARFLGGAIGCEARSS